MTEIETSRLLAGKYYIKGAIGQGGMGQIYYALQGEFKRPVAVKIIDLQNMSRDMQLRFQREMRTLMTLQIPNVIQILDYDKFEGHDFFVMPLLEGGSLRQRMDLRAEYNHPFPSLSEANLLLQSLANALHHVHQNGIIHRDIKPSNIMFDKVGNPYLIDFGIARDNDPNLILTSSGMAIGTPRYMCLDQRMGKRPTSVFDLYSLGLVIYEMLNGSLPYASIEHDYIDKYIEDIGKQAPLENWREELPLKLRSVFEKVLWQNPTNSYANVLEFAHAFSNAAILVEEDTEYFRRSVGQLQIDPTKTHPSLRPKENKTSETQQSSITEPKRALPRGTQTTLLGIGIFGALILAAILLWRVIFPETLAISTPTVVVAGADTATLEATAPEVGVVNATTASTLTEESTQEAPTQPPPTATATPTPTATLCETLVGAVMTGIDQWQSSGCVTAFQREDSRLGPMVLVPCLADDTDCTPIWINRYEITREQYRNETGNLIPATNIAAINAGEWCEGRGGRLLSEAEWKRGSGTAYGRTYPWGMEARDDYPEAGEPYPVTAYALDESWSGMVGAGSNVAEYIVNEQVIGGHFNQRNAQERYRIDGTIRPLGGRDVTVGFRCAQDFQPTNET